MDLAHLHGCGTALATPLHSDGSLDLATLRNFVQWQVKSGIKVLVACGSTGEASTLSQAETLDVVRTVAEAAADKAFVVAGCTHNSTAEAIRRAREIAAVPGVDAILTACPYYNKPSQEGMFLHFSFIAEAVAPLPIILYNVPGRTASNLLPATVARLAEIENIVGLKESSGNLEQIAQTISLVPKAFRVFSGDDGIAVPTMKLGAVGLISVASNVAPSHLCELVHAATNHDTATAERIAEQLTTLVEDLFAEPSPAPVKSLLQTIGQFPADHLRLPMVPVSEALRSRLQADAETLQLMPQAVR